MSHHFLTCSRHPVLRAFAALVCVLGLVSALDGAETDVVIADFEGDSYGDWKTTGDAFGSRPADGTLPGQMPVSGFVGNGLVNSFHGGDASTGTLTSPTFAIQRHYMRFLIGGGGYAEQTCMNLLIDDEVVRTATGPNTAPGGSEELIPDAWDLTDLVGRQAVIQIVDRRTGGWGHINVDHIVLTDEKPEIPERPGLVVEKRELRKDYLLFPIRTGARKAQVDLRIDGQSAREFDAELAESEEAADFWSFLDIRDFRGKTAELQINGTTPEHVALIRQSDEIPSPPNAYDEVLRPQFHFSQLIGWNNDPNGMVYYDGEWHLYFQHNPYGWAWGNMHWGHAVSRDLVHWKQLPIAIYNKQRGDWAFSGGAVVDERNTAGWQTGDEKVIVASWTSTGRGECLAYSNDRGRTFTEYTGNPVVQHAGRDPKIIWYEPGQHWVMAVYDEHDGQRAIAFYSSPDLKRWEFQSRLNGYFECPEIFELPVNGKENETRWVVFAADARYALGTFDGKTFTPEHEGKHQVHYGQFYASQTFSNTPNGRHIQIGWARIAMPDMPFNQTFGFPLRLTLRTTEDGVRMFAEPVEEIEKLHQQSHQLGQQRLGAASPVELPVSGELFDIRATFEVAAAQKLGLDLGGNRIVYDAERQTLNEMPLKPVDGRITVQVLLDRPMMEVCGNRGRVFLTASREHTGAISSITAFAEGGAAKLIELQAFELESIWESNRDSVNQ